MKVIILLLASVMSSMASSTPSTPSCCLCKFATEELQAYLDSTQLDSMATELMTRYACVALSTTAQECTHLIQATRVLMKKMLEDSPPNTWCSNLEFCPLEHQSLTFSP